MHLIYNFKQSPRLAGARRGRKGREMIGEILRKMRCIYGYSVEEIGEDISSTPARIRSIEAGRESPRCLDLESYSKVFLPRRQAGGVKPSSLLLLSENHDKFAEKGLGKQFTRNLMIKLIDLMAAHTEEINENMEEK
jgi:hypothetical protein